MPLSDLGHASHVYSNTFSRPVDFLLNFMSANFCTSFTGRNPTRVGIPTLPGYPHRLKLYPGNVSAGLFVF
eukprot:234795-Rhodomonas_salina.1